MSRAAEQQQHSALSQRAERCRVNAGFCKQQLWPLFHYLLPLSPLSSGRFQAELWQAYIKANKVQLGLPCSAQ